MIMSVLLRAAVGCYVLIVLDFMKILWRPSIGIIGPKQYLHVKDKHLYSFQESHSEDEVMGASTGI
ncbi:hypothetical protein MTR_2g104310 [Medicago truncatula]|uniref:Uncharacterized protein n=1 Tax=Medicago truncatula TaxID=3880 RepID=G7IIB2_MEDTR|nr:hypothetical protein MTR_2g104310 [Medicago truncatula]